MAHTTVRKHVRHLRFRTVPVCKHARVIKSNRKDDHLLNLRMMAAFSPREERVLRARARAGRLFYPSDGALISEEELVGEDINKSQMVKKSGYFGKVSRGDPLPPVELVDTGSFSMSAPQASHKVNLGYKTPKKELTAEQKERREERELSKFVPEGYIKLPSGSLIKMHMVKKSGIFSKRVPKEEVYYDQGLQQNVYVTPNKQKAARVYGSSPSKVLVEGDGVYKVIG